MTTDWQPTPKPVPDELAPGFEHATYEVPRIDSWATIAARLDSDILKQLGGYMTIGEPER